MTKKLTFLILLCFSINVNSQKNITLNSDVPDFKLWLLDDSTITKKSIKNKVVVFKFWFTSCPPCINDIPKMNSLVKEFKNRKDVLFIAPALDQKNVVKKLIQRFPFHFKLAYNSYDVSKIFNKKQVYPSYFVIDKKGKVIFVDSSNKESNFEDLRTIVVKALKV